MKGREGGKGRQTDRQTEAETGCLAELEDEADEGVLRRVVGPGEVRRRAPEGHHVGVPDAHQHRQLQQHLPQLRLPPPAPAAPPRPAARPRRRLPSRGGGEGGSFRGPFDHVRGTL